MKKNEPEKKVRKIKKKIHVYILNQYEDEEKSHILGVYLTRGAAEKRKRRLLQKISNNLTYAIIKQTVKGAETVNDLIFLHKVSSGPVISTKGSGCNIPL